MLATFSEYLWSFLTCGAQISYKTNTVGRSVLRMCSFFNHTVRINEAVTTQQ